MLNFLLAITGALELKAYESYQQLTLTAHSE